VEIRELRPTIKSIFEQLNRMLSEKIAQGNIIEHNLEKGLGGENALRGLLEDFLPSRLGVAKGKVVNFTGDMSRQCDVIIYDRLNGPRLFVDENKNQILPIEGVYAVIEVKTSLTKHTLRVIQGTWTLCEVYPVRRCGTIKRWPVHERIELPHLIHRTGHHVHHTTGFDREEIIDLCIRINSVQPGAGSPNWPPCLGLFRSVVAALTYMRHNRTQAEIGESLGVSQPTISRAISAVTPLVPEATREFVPTADDLDPDAQYILDGTLLPCWSWDGHKELYSGKHKTTGMNLQVACTIYGKLAWISDPVNGSRHDNYCREESGVLLTINPRNWIGDKGYIGNNMITPFRKPAGGELLDWQKEYNSEVNRIRWTIEQVISHFKNWTIMHTDYRRPLKTFETTISAVVGLHFYRTV
jgi:hypothetical protein